MADKRANTDRPVLRLVNCPTGELVEVAGSSILVGRHSKADLRLPQSEVSRRHCRIVLVGDRWRVYDLSSTNGTFVNEHRIRETDLEPGDLLRIGGSAFRLPQSKAS